MPRQLGPMSPYSWALRIVAIAHFVWGALLLALALLFAGSAFRVLPQMSTGTVWTNLPSAVVLAVTFALPPGALGIWLLTLGRWTWNAKPKARSALLATHACLLPLGALAMAYGVFALHRASESAARGGGLL